MSGPSLRSFGETQRFFTKGESPMLRPSIALPFRWMCLVGPVFWTLPVVWTLVGCKSEEARQQDLAAQEAAAQPPAAAPIQNQVAGVGVGIKGRSLEGGSDYNPAKFASGPAAAYFRTKEKIVFEIQIPHTLNAYQALNGRYPRSHDEYMKEIIGTAIKLPQLPKGMVYRYHPETHDLWVEAETATADSQIENSNNAIQSGNSPLSD